MEAQKEDLVPSQASPEPFKPGKTYLNNAEKLNFYKLVGFNSFLKAFAQDVKGRGWDAGLVKQLEQGFLYTEAVAKQIIRSLDVEITKKIMSESKKMSIVAMYSRDALDAYKKTLELDSRVPVTRELLSDALLALDEVLCTKCPRWPEDFADCPVYKMYIELEIDVVQDSPAPGICPFSRYEETDCRLCDRYHKKCEATRASRLDGTRCRDFKPRRTGIKKY